MKYKILLVLSVIAMLSIGVTAYAVNSNHNTVAKAAACCCCSGDSCPMKSKEAKTVAATDEATHSCDCSCCKDGSCPMRSKMASADKTAASSDEAKSCPMMKDGKMSHDDHKMMKANADGSTTCDCSCCAKEKKVDAAA